MPEHEEHETHSTTIPLDGGVPVQCYCKLMDLGIKSALLMGFNQVDARGLGLAVQRETKHLEGELDLQAAALGALVKYQALYDQANIAYLEYKFSNQDAEDYEEKSSYYYAAKESYKEMYNEALEYYKVTKLDKYAGGEGGVLGAGLYFQGDADGSESKITENFQGHGKLYQFNPEQVMSKMRDCVQMLDNSKLHEYAVEPLKTITHAACTCPHLITFHVDDSSGTSQSNFADNVLNKIGAPVFSLKASVPLPDGKSISGEANVTSADFNVIAEPVATLLQAELEAGNAEP